MIKVAMKSINALTDRALLVILDGYGVNENQNKNAIKDASTPNLDKLFTHSPFTLIEAGGTSVGLPKGVVGNSEVGHMNLGAGRPIRQDLVRINESIEQGKFKDLPLLKELRKKAIEGSGRIHIMGLLSDGGVHSHINHIKETAKALQSEGIEIFFHAFMDGRDTKKNVGGTYISELAQTPGLHFASMQGRSIGMDRDRRWEKTELCYKTFLGLGHIEEITPIKYLQREYQNERFDEFITPVLFNSNYAMKEKDSVFFINFRPDRAIQLSMAMNHPDFNEFERAWRPYYFLCMTPYIQDEMELPILFNKEKVRGGISEYLSIQQKKQFKIAETEKYAHVTFFFNGGEKKPFEGEEHVLVPSPRDVSTYDQKPEMSAPEVTQKLLKALEDKTYSFYLVNFANSDMVGHTGNYQAAIKAIETLDDSVGQLMEKCRHENIALFLTADHGNSDQMTYPDGSPHTSHTGAPVPFALYKEGLTKDDVKIAKGQHSLKDVAPTLLNCLNIPFPSNFTGISIFE
jgi:2,3-bisphosphoglycerate-independent phosphoglycerate mutase